MERSAARLWTTGAAFAVGGGLWSAVWVVPAFFCTPKHNADTFVSHMTIVSPQLLSICTKEKGGFEGQVMVAPPRGAWPRGMVLLLGTGADLQTVHFTCDTCCFTCVLVRIHLIVWILAPLNNGRPGTPCLYQATPANLVSFAEHMDEIEEALLQDTDEPPALCLALRSCRHPLHARAQLHTHEGTGLDGLDPPLADVWLCGDVMAVVDTAQGEMLIASRVDASRDLPAGVAA